MHIVIFILVSMVPLQRSGELEPSQAVSCCVSKACYAAFIHPSHRRQIEFSYRMDMDMDMADGYATREMAPCIHRNGMG